MTGLALLLILSAAVLHASWNFLVKRGTNQEVLVWLSQVALSIFMVPVALILLWLYPVGIVGWWFVLGTVILHVLYFLFLGRGYARADLSVVYPIARGMGPALVPLLGVSILGEEISIPAIIGIIAVIMGIYTVYWWGHFGQILKNPLQLIKEPGSRYAVMTGLIIAAYSVWDKVGISHVTPFLYMYLMSVGSALGLGPYLYSRHGTASIVREWRQNFRGILAVGLMTFVAYGLVLTAFQFSRVSYIAPSREVGIVFGVLLGVLVLKEPFGRGRVFGSSLIVAGLALIVFAK